MYNLQEGDLFVQIVQNPERSDLIYNAGRATAIEHSGESRLPIEDHEQIISMTEEFLKIAKHKLEEEKKIRISGMKLKESN